MIIDGNVISRKILEALQPQIKSLQQKQIVPKLTIILIGSNPAAESYIRRKSLTASTLGIQTENIRLPESTNDAELAKLILKINSDEKVQALIIQRPLPTSAKIDPATSLLIDPAKDVDGFVPGSFFRVPVVMAVLFILMHYFRVDNENILIGKLKNKSLVIIGRGETAGKPLAHEFAKLGLKYSVIHSQTPQPQRLLKNADIIISCVGHANIVRRELIKTGAVLISVGISKNSQGKLTGDYQENEIKDSAGAYTPTPGGVGPVNVACLMQNVLDACLNQLQKTTNGPLR
jgi:methylenetetrahydrofolate dehydrogenase (NADP+)/methenyltetrahydrofolate cyclohydrolase